MTGNSNGTVKKPNNTKKPVVKTEAVKFPRKAVPLVLIKGDSEEVAARKFSKLATSPELAAYRVIGASESKTLIGGELDVPSLLDELRGQAKAVNNGELAQAEAMLMNQATALQSLFARLTERAMGNDTIPAFEANMRMALRAQSQCRSTIETISTIKNPPVVYAKQANFAAGHQQVNNGIPAPTQAREIENQPSKLLEAQHGKWMDTGTAGATSGTDKAMASVGKVNGAKVG